jgi:hypothetical protein
MKLLTPVELADIIRKACTEDEIDDRDTYRHFLEELGALVAEYFGGECYAASDDSGADWFIHFKCDENVPADGGVYATYDTDVTWKDGEEL